MRIIKADLTNTAHGSAFVELLNQYALDPMGGGQALSDYTKQNLVKELKERPGMHILLAFDGNTPVGLATCIEGFSTFQCRPLMNIHDMTVAAEHRGRGISKQLLRAAEDLAREKGCCKLTLEVLEGNKIAKAAYTSFGFEGYELDPKMGKALFMEKKF